MKCLLYGVNDMKAVWHTFLWFKINKNEPLVQEDVLSTRKAVFSILWALAMLLLLTLI